MAATTISPVKITREGVVVAAVACDATNGNQMALTGFEQVEVINGAASAITVTFVCQSKNTRGLTNPNKSVQITNGTTVVFGPFQKADWADTNGNLQITWTPGAPSTVTVRASYNLVSNPASDTE